MTSWIFQDRFAHHPDLDTIDFNLRTTVEGVVTAAQCFHDKGLRWLAGTTTYVACA
jgi:hypothetical protein